MVTLQKSFKELKVFPGGGIKTAIGFLVVGDPTSTQMEEVLSGRWSMGH